MANEEHVAWLKQGPEVWSAWRRENPDIEPDLRMADLRMAHLRWMNLSGADLSFTDLSGADLSGANFSGANLRKANLIEADLSKADLRGANLSEADLSKADLRGANLSEANLSGARLSEAILFEATLSGANLGGADLSGANLTVANLSGADLSGADLEAATLLETDLTVADLTGCHVYGISAWGLKLDGAKQQNLVITRKDEPEITVDNIKVAQFVHLLLHDEKIRDIDDTDAITSKAVLILGRFAEERKAVLDAMRDELRNRGYLPILFDFDKPAHKTSHERIALLARMARFVIADLTDPSSIPKELEAIVPHFAVPLQSLIAGADRPFAMFKDYTRFPWVLPIHRYDTPEQLIADLGEKVIHPAEIKVQELERVNNESRYGNSNRGGDRFEGIKSSTIINRSRISGSNSGLKGFVRQGLPCEPARSLSPTTPAGASAVDAAVFCPPSVPRKSRFLVQVCLYLPGDEDVAVARAREADPDAGRRGTYSFPLDVPPNTRVDVHLEMPGLEVEEPDAVLIWRNRLTTAQFEVGVPAAVPDTAVIGRVRFAVAGVPAGTLRFTVGLDAVGATAGPVSAREAEAERYRRAFVSYSSQDRLEVLKRVHAFRIAGLSVFQDILNFEPGERWERGLYREIDNCDVFLLFWSKAAAASEWVAKEIAYALERKAGSDDKPPAIQPVPIEGPPPPSPPDALRHLHFNDALLAHIQVAAASAQSAGRESP